MEAIRRFFRRVGVIILWLAFAIGTLLITPWLDEKMQWWSVAPLFALSAFVGLTTARVWPPKKPKAHK